MPIYQLPGGILEGLLPWKLCGGLKTCSAETEMEQWVHVVPQISKF
jgi:hypothetical protein